MDTVKIERKERVQMFLKEYYFGQHILLSLLRMTVWPLLPIGCLLFYLEAPQEFETLHILLTLAAVYYAFQPLWWLQIKWKYFKTVQFQLEVLSDRIMIQEGESEPKTEYAKFEKILKRKDYFVLLMQKGLKVCLPFDKISEGTIKILNEKLNS